VGKRGGGHGKGAPKLEEADPEKFATVKAALEAGTTVKEIVATHDVSTRTLSRIRADYPDKMPGVPGMKLEERDPEKFKEICQALTAQVPINIIAEELGTSPTTVSRIRREYGAQFPEWRTAASSSLAWNVTLLAESMRDDIRSGKITPGQKAFALSVSGQNAQLLAGQATTISETRNSPAIKQVNSALEALEVLDAEIIEEEAKKD